MTAVELAEAIRRGERSPVDVTDAYLDRIDAHNDDLNAYVTVIESAARERAQAAQQAVEAGDLWGPLHGVPIAIKDLYAYKAGVRNTYGSVPFADHVPDEDALVVERLEAAGAIVLGKTNTPEFGHKGVTDNDLFGPTSTPFDLGRNAGGSSGGSAAAVATGLAAAAQGSDGGGSIRIPAAFCGVYGLKPTYGRVPHLGRPDAFATHTPMALAGPITRTVADAALLLGVMAGPHPRDPLSAPDDGTDFASAIERGIEGARVAYSPTLGLFPVDDAVREVVDDAVGRFADAGAMVERVELAYGYSRAELVEAWLTVSRVKYAALAERLAASGVDLVGDHREDVAAELLDIIEGAPRVSGVEFKRTDVPRTAVFDAVQDILESYDFLVSPTVATLPVENGRFAPATVGGEAVDPYVGWFLTWPFNLTGHPAASIPAGLADGLPVGMQVVGHRFADADVLAASAAFEAEQPWLDTLEAY